MRNSQARTTKDIDNANTMYPSFRCPYGMLRQDAVTDGENCEQYCGDHQDDQEDVMKSYAVAMPTELHR